MTSIAIAGYGSGAVIWNPLETAFVNPGNIQVQPVPGEDDDLYFTDPRVLDLVPKLFLLLGGIILGLFAMGFFMVRDPTPDEMEEAEEMQLGAKEPAEEESEEKDSLEDKSVKTMDALKSFNFWIVWLSFFSMNLLLIFISNYAKSFGQNYIQDDQYFAIVATVQNVINGSSRVIWGIIYDRMGYKVRIASSVC